MIASTRFVAGGIALVVLGMIVACSDDDPPKAAPVDVTGACELLGRRCHPVKSPLGVECHNLGHDSNDDAACAARKDCLAECPEGYDAGIKPTPTADASTKDAETDAGDAADTAPPADPCIDHCACMEGTCKTLLATDYPYANQEACLTKCRGLTEGLRSCVINGCNTAKTSGVKHDCEHAADPDACH